jgi:hypothetical protein
MTAAMTHSSRRGSLLAEVTMATVILVIAMTLTLRVLAMVALERRDFERRQRAVIEVANLMERVTAVPFDQVDPELARGMTLSDAGRRLLPDSDLAVDVQPKAGGGGRPAKRISIKLRWRGRSGEWAAPVRLTSWIERRGEGA